MSGEREDGCEDAGGRQRDGGKKYVIFGFCHLHHLVGHLGVCGGFCTRDREMLQVRSELY